MTTSASAEVTQSPGSPLWKKLALGSVFVAAIAGFFYFDLHHLVTFDTLKAKRDELLAYTHSNYTRVVGLYLISYTLFVALNLPGAVVFTLAGGLLFGPLLATLYVNIAATTGATVAFLAARYLFHDWVERKFGHRLKAIQEGFSNNALSYILSLRLVPVFPFFIVNVLLGLTRVKVSTYILATSLGIIPGTFIYAYAGRQLGAINSLREVASPQIVLAFTLLGLLALAPVLYRRLAAR